MAMGKKLVRYILAATLLAHALSIQLRYKYFHMHLSEHLDQCFLKELLNPNVFSIVSPVYEASQFLTGMLLLLHSNSAFYIGYLFIFLHFMIFCTTAGPFPSSFEICTKPICVGLILFYLQIFQASNRHTNSGPNSKKLHNTLKEIDRLQSQQMQLKKLL